MHYFLLGQFPLLSAGMRATSRKLEAVFLARTGYALSREAVTLSDNGKNQCDERILAGRPTQGFRSMPGVRSVARFESRVKDGNFANRLLFTKRICLICNPAADLLEPTNLPFIFIRQKRCLSRA